ncbi:FKBP-type peptidyl-prolyl cis-trans isomerase [Sphingomonas kyeonggiensis]|uniref:FKBP-type peptidyl-prolyl cis-trans isomerase n=1 Tax=Sphingomonas kyeonggiensis TaxID=1268553 RepID=UPI00277D8CCB|nr:FKBP-type peptidyl-prolyl cis-trans isomerase [Sphingomonas kyeonggiensis]MDQ0251498.1 FKBP-type peptidyl-prolyl cis-trans isomerase [Sphingomonas kyeonggiensis]
MSFLAALALLAVQDAPAPDRSQDMAYQSQQMLALAKLNGAQGWNSTPEGLRWRRIKGDGSGKHPTVADTVTLHYAGTFIDGETFDSSYDRGEPATFPLARLIKGWQVAVPLMGVGDTFEVAIPANLGYGFEGKGPIPGGATLLFRIELLDIPAAG